MVTVLLVPFLANAQPAEELLLQGKLKRKTDMFGAGIQMSIVSSIINIIYIKIYNI
jgi:hypothetical protein